MGKITYGAPRLVDWVAQIKVGSASVRVHFTGGALTSYGVTPAEYTTSSPFIQKVIEQSRYYKEGRIITVRKKDVAGASHASKVAHSSKTVIPGGGDSDKSIVECKGSIGDVAEVGNACSKECETDDTAEVESVNMSVSESIGEGMVEVAVNCLQDAHAYLQEKYGIASHKIRSYEATQCAAAEHGVRFTGGKFDEHSGGEA